jgi:hypothetical protein
MLRGAAAAALALAVAAGAIAGCGSSAKKSPTSTPTAPASTTPKQGQLIATLSAPNHSPKVGSTWRITVTAHDRAGHPVKAHVQYLFLYNGAVVARRSNYAFEGVFHDTINWPANAIGLPLTFRALVTSSVGTQALDYPVKVSR